MEKTSDATPKQTPKHVANKKRSHTHLQSCGIFRTTTPTQRQKTQNTAF
ncbi:MAG: hypothetical protein NWE92_11090 [Candidatus Bathyarchaeota archaeon]|nr:hypothetical protein [Candidatus Bathyarchaeota archaeon]